MCNFLTAGNSVAGTSTGRTILNFNNHWGFYRGNLSGAEAIAFDDSAFANVTIPHTMRLEEKDANGSTSTYKGIGWYRRYFTVDPSYQDKKIHIDFEGVMIEADVYLNGTKLTTHKGGYMGFSVDITNQVQFNNTNVLAIKVSNLDNPDIPPGKPEANLDFHYYGGIYRDVTMRITDKIYISDPLQANKIASGGIFVTYSNVSAGQATVIVKTHVVNENTVTCNNKVISKLVDKDGNTIAQEATPGVPMSAGSDYQFSQTFAVTNPTLWSPDSPYLYTLESEVYADNILVDTQSTRVGIRTIRYDKDGFYMNGQKLYLRGANRHQAQQNVGDASSNSMQYRDALQLKADGFNAVRAAHYPADPAFLDACDEVGLVVIECQPGWQNFTNTQTFYDFTIRDAREMIRRDRNHPSVVLWETSLNETGYSASWASAVTQAAHSEYPGDQFYTAADYGSQGNYYDVNYKVVDTNWSTDPKKWTDANPNKPFFTREWGDYESSSKALLSQGEQQMITQVRTRQRYLNGDGYSDWGGLDANGRIGGYFLWSYNDYARGSTTITSGSGTVDINRYEKYGYYWLKSMQSARNPVYGPMVFIASSYSPTSSLSVDVYSNTDSVKLYQNNVLVQEITRNTAKAVAPNIVNKGGSPIYIFNLSQFISGELKAEGILDGAVVATHTVKTPGTVTRLEVEVRDRGITPVADGSDLIPVYIKAVDNNGTVVPTYTGAVTLTVSGNGELVGKSISRIKVETQNLVSGIGFAFVRTSVIAGGIQISASTNGLTTGSTSVNSATYTGQFVPDGVHTPWIGGVEKLESTYYINLAQGKAVTGSSVQTGNDLAKATDNNVTTRWAASSSALPQWIQVDLGQKYSISGFETVWEFTNISYKYTIQVSEDAINWQTILDLSGNTAINPSPDTRFINTTGRYVRLNITGTTNGKWASLYEFRVLQKDGSSEINPGAVIPNSAVSIITATGGYVSNRGSDKLRDNITDIGSGWLSASKTFPQSVTIKFNKPQVLLGSRIYWEKDSSSYTYDLDVSTDGVTWTPIYSNRTVSGQYFKADAFPSTKTNVNYVRITIKNVQSGSSDYNIGIAEWIIYGREDIAVPRNDFDYLSDLTWKSATSDFTDVVKDKAVWFGTPLELNTSSGRTTYMKGLSADTNSMIIYDVTGKGYNVFNSYIGINAAASKNGGEAIFKVYSDGILVYTSGVKMRDDNADFISIVITGVKEIKLVAEWNNNTNNPEARYNTHIDWADAQFIKYVMYQNLAQGKIVTGSSAQTGNALAKATDNNVSTRWAASSSAMPQWIQVDLGQKYNISGFETIWEFTNTIYKYNIQVSDDAVNWQTVVDQTGNTTINLRPDTKLSNTAGRYVQLNIMGTNNGSWASLYEFRILQRVN